MSSESLATRLRDGETLIGASSSISPAVAEIAGRLGYDWLFIDAEAFPLPIPQILELLRAAEVVGTPAVVRMNDDNPADIRQILDMGAAGVIIPLVKTAAQARDIVDAAKFQPLGKRGITASRARHYGYGRNATDFAASANAHTLVIVMVEEAEGLANVGEIAATEGLDGIFVGPGDMAVSLGRSGDPMHDDMQAAFRAIGKAARQHGIALGTFPSSKAMYELCYAEGYRLFLAGLDTGFVKTAAETRLAEMRSWYD